MIERTKLEVTAKDIEIARRILSRGRDIVLDRNQYVTAYAAAENETGVAHFTLNRETVSPSIQQALILELESLGAKQIIYDKLQTHERAMDPWQFALYEVKKTDGHTALVLSVAENLMRREQTPQNRASNSRLF